jgi:stage II sporulation protein M
MGRTLEELLFNDDLFKAWTIYIIIFSVALIAETLVYNHTSQSVLLNEIIRKFKEVLPSTRNPLILFVIIFFHNFVIAMIMLIFSFTFVIPVAIMLLNGVIVGYVISYSFGRLGVPGTLAGLAPHGGLEIPAIALAAAIGILIRKGLREYFKALGVASLVVTLMLFIAALTESIITPLLTILTIKALA